jgi:putative tryptophan/tyrosine transport system substrate-binding protein
MIRRREFIRLLGGAATFQFGWPLATRAQQSAQPVIGFLGAGSPEQWASRLGAFHRGLADAGYAEGRNVMVEYRWAESRNDRLQALVADLVSRQVTVIAAPGSTLAAHVAKGMTATIPIVFATGADPVKEGLVASLNRPGGNVTGITLLGVEIGPKQLELLREMAGNGSGAEADRTDGQSEQSRHRAADYGRRAGGCGVAGSRSEGAARQRRARIRSGVCHLGRAAARGAHHRARHLLRHPPAATRCPDARSRVAGDPPVPGLCGGRRINELGTDVDDSFRLSGIYAGRVLKGEKPAELPVQRATRVAFVVNMKTANALGLIVPPTLLARADEVIE